MTVKELRQKYLEFFKTKEHAIIPGAPLIPENDPTVLFTTAGMHPLVPFLCGEKHPEGKRLANVQKCIRTTDIEEVGDDTHLTFFEMLGNWSLGDYGKREAIEMSVEFLTSSKWLNIPINKLAVTVFEGDKEVPRDTDAAKVWKEQGIVDHKITYMDRSENWWGPAGETGPCGPDTEMFYYVGEGEPSQKSNPKVEPDKWVEIWNDVFMVYNKTGEGKYEDLRQSSIDTGMGLERTSAILQGKKTVYEIELFTPLINQLERLCNYKYEDRLREFRIICDHARAAAFILAERIEPSNLDQGYILRRLIRRAYRYGKTLNIEGSFLSKIAEIVINQMRGDYPELAGQQAFIISQIAREEERFEKTLERGMREFKKLSMDGTLSGKEAFDLFATYGFPYEMTEEMARERSININKEEFDKKFKEHQKVSRKGAEGKFKGGLKDNEEATKRLHTTTHLLHAALRKVLGVHVEQRGSNITSERLRFDFSHTKKLTDEEKKKVEDLVNNAIGEEYQVVCEELPTETARREGALGVFGHKYGAKVKVYTIGGDKKMFSKEICGGPHVDNTNVLGKFRIKKEESVSQGVRRIKGILE